MCFFSKFIIDISLPCFIVATDPVYCHRGENARKHGAEEICGATGSMIPLFAQKSNRTSKNKLFFEKLAAGRR